MQTDAWPKDDRIDWMLFRSQLEHVDFDTRVLAFDAVVIRRPTSANAATRIFSLLKKEYDTPRNRALRRHRAVASDAGDACSRQEAI